MCVLLYFSPLFSIVTTETLKGVLSKLQTNHPIDTFSLDQPCELRHSHGRVELRCIQGQLTSGSWWS